MSAVIIYCMKVSPTGSLTYHSMKKRLAGILFGEERSNQNSSLVKQLIIRIKKRKRKEGKMFHNLDILNLIVWQTNQHHQMVLLRMGMSREREGVIIHLHRVKLRHQHRNLHLQHQRKVIKNVTS